MKDLEYITVIRVLDTWDAARRISGSDQVLGNRVVERYVFLRGGHVGSLVHSWLIDSDHKSINSISHKHMNESDYLIAFLPHVCKFYTSDSLFSNLVSCTTILLILTWLISRAITSTATELSVFWIRSYNCWDLIWNCLPKFAPKWVINTHAWKSPRLIFPNWAWPWYKPCKKHSIINTTTIIQIQRRRAFPKMIWMLGEKCTRP